MPSIRERRAGIPACASGIQISQVVSGKVTPGGSTPTIRASLPATQNDLPTAAGSPPKRRCQCGMAQDRDAGSADDVLVWAEHATQQGGDAKDVEHVRGGERRPDGRRLAARSPGEEFKHLGVRAQLAERADLLSEDLDLREPRESVFTVVLRIGRKDEEETLRIAVRRRRGVQRRRLR